MGYHPGWRGNCVISYQGFLLFASTTQETMDPFPFCYLQKHCQNSGFALFFRHLKILVLNRECVSMGAAGAQTRISLGYHLLHPLILRLLVLCAPELTRMHLPPQIQIPNAFPAKCALVTHGMKEHGSKWKEGIFPNCSGLPEDEVFTIRLSTSAIKVF